MKSETDKEAPPRWIFGQYKAVQFFPDFFDFGELNRMGLVHAIGNAVPPRAGYVVALPLLIAALEQEFRTGIHQVGKAHEHVLQDKCLEDYQKTDESMSEPQAETVRVGNELAG